MIVFRRLLSSPFETAAVVVLLLTAAFIALARASHRELARGREEALAVLSEVRSAQAESQTTRARFLTSFKEMRARLAPLEVTVDGTTTAKTEHYRFFLSVPSSAEAWRVVAVGNLDEDEWPDIVVTQGSVRDSSAPLVTSDDITHRVVRVPAPR